MSEEAAEKLSKAWQLVEEAVREEDIDKRAGRIAVNGQQKIGEAIAMMENGG